MLLVLHLVVNRLLYFYRLMLFNEAIKLLELFLFKVNSLLVIYQYIHYCFIYLGIVQYFFVIVVLSRDQSIQKY